VTIPFYLQTSRLQLRWLQQDDASFILRLVNDAQWLQFIGDKQVANLDAARAYIENGPQAMYRNFGFGLNRIALKQGDVPIGICGLLQRDSMQDCDLGFALLPEFRNSGYAFEAATAILQHGFTQFDKSRIAAIVNADNRASINLLIRLGFQREKPMCMEPNEDPVDLYVIQREF
jgi:RimJ/RimL family protein N-acetyltransferase